MKKINFFTFSFKKHILPTIFCVFTICLVLFSRQNLEAAKSGLSLWANAVVTSLLPFFIATELLGYTNITRTLGKLFSRIMRPLFNVPGEGAFAFIMGIISGYPMGAKIVTDFREKGICTKVEGERLLAFTNNSGPLFIIGTVGISLFGDSQTGFLLFFTHILACISVGILFRFWKRNSTCKKSSEKFSVTNSSSSVQVNFSNLGEILAKSIMNGVQTVVMIGGFVMLFSVIISILNNSHLLEFASQCIKPFLSSIGIPSSFASAILTGILELTNGVKQVASISIKTISINITLCAFLLGFGGFSVLLQVYSITSKSDVSIKAYLIGKLLQGTLAAIYTYLLLRYVPFLNLDLTPVFSNTATPLVATNPSFFTFFCLALIGFVLLWKVCFSKRKKQIE